MPTQGRHHVDGSARTVVEGNRVARGQPEGRCVCHPEWAYREAASLAAGGLYPYESRRDSPPCSASASWLSRPASRWLRGWASFLCRPQTALNIPPILSPVLVCPCSGESLPPGAAVAYVPHGHIKCMRASPRTFLPYLKTGRNHSQNAAQTCSQSFSLPQW